MRTLCANNKMDLDMKFTSHGDAKWSHWKFAGLHHVEAMSRSTSGPAIKCFVSESLNVLSAFALLRFASSECSYTTGTSGGTGPQRENDTIYFRCRLFLTRIVKSPRRVPLLFDRPHNDLVFLYVKPHIKVDPAVVTKLPGLS